ncbi:MAG: RNA polymerase sigma factor RpoH [Gammaproteobacteria bacterium]|nr:RNA polymerase sigma factor RpoH [Gammaproteobacteria bacterium]
MGKDLVKSKDMMMVPVSSLNAYITAAYGIPVLEAEEEQRLARLYRQKNDVEAARKLAMHNLRFVIQIARGYNGYGLALGDLIQEGNIGLLKAIQRFDPAIGVRLVSFAVHWIRAEIHEFIIKNWRIVKIATTKAQRKLFFNLRSSKKRLGWMNQGEVKEIATQLGVKPEEVTEMEKRLAQPEMSIDPTPDTNDEMTYSPIAYLSDEREVDPAEHFENIQAGSYNRRKLNEALKSLDERSLAILKARWLSAEKATLHELAAQYKVSAERIRQIESQALQKLRVAIEE